MLNNLREIANHYHITRDDFVLAYGMIGSAFKMADMIIAPDGVPYLYRWHIVPRNDKGNVYFHIQVADDPARPLHDHPWDNQSVILAGGYDEMLAKEQHRAVMYYRSVGDVICREAEWGHRLRMRVGVSYTMTLFSTGPKRRRWGFWYPEGWVDASKICQLDGNTSKHIRKEGV